MYGRLMRTTIDIDDAHRAKLLELAARRGEKGFSRIVSEAIEAYLESESRSEAARRKVLSLRGRLKADEAEGLRARCAELRREWR